MNTQTDLPDIPERSPLPWRAEDFVSLPIASVKAANGRCVALCAPDDAALIVAAVNAVAPPAPPPHLTIEQIIADRLDDGEVRSPHDRCAVCEHVARLYGVRVPCDGEPVCAIEQPEARRV